MATSLLPGVGGSPLEQVCVALDLETTGLSPETEEIIEVAAVKFRGHEVVDAFQTLVNPYRPIPLFVRRFTGITDGDVRGAPPFATVAGDLQAFVGDCPVVGHNVQFDLSFLAHRGLRLSNTPYDTLHLATVVLPQARDYSLSRLTQTLGLEHQRPHRALDDAHAARRVFVALVQRALEMDPGVLAQMARLSSRSPWHLRTLLACLGADQGRPSGVGMAGVELQAVARRLERPGPLTPNQAQEPVDVASLLSLLKEGEALWRRFPSYEPRPQQAKMLEAVARAFNGRAHVVVEGGTGIGKTVAYLLPAMRFAVQNRARVLISTNTINLQEQLVRKDIPALMHALQEEPWLKQAPLRYGTLKGKANYVCLRRWAALSTSPELTAEEAQMAARTLVWLQATDTGDREELSLSPREMGVWDRVSARGFSECPGAREGACFYRCARERAAAAHLLVINHALLLSDLTMGGTLLPPYDYLIVDEAHHLEEEATRHFGFRVAQEALEEQAEDLARWLTTLRAGLRASTMASSRAEGLEDLARRAESALPPAREEWGHLCMRLARFAREHQEAAGDRTLQMRLTAAVHSQPGWSPIEVLADKVAGLLGESVRAAGDLYGSLGGLEEASIPDYDTLMLELSNWLQTQGELRDRLQEVVLHPDRGNIYWVAQEGREGALTLNAAPLQVAPILRDRLFSKKASVVLTSATLSTQGAFSHIREQVGLDGGEELLVDSPFDYPRAALVLLPEDMPPPEAGEYQEALQRAVVELATAAQGRTMVLFTSHSALQAARRGLQETLEATEIRVAAQGVDGSPRRLVEQFQENPGMVLLGTASFWEGVDIGGDALKVLVVARLPFNVPTEPVFAARSELFDDPFHQYAVPLAVLRFRQGFGRLIRSRSDRGAAVILDRRVLSRGYGAVFLGSIPPCTVKRVRLREVSPEVKKWLTG